MKCPYCSHDFKPDDWHKAHALAPYCSHGCKYAVELPNSNAGQSFVSIQANPAFDAQAIANECGSSTDNMQHVAEFFAELLKLDTYTIFILARRVYGMHYPEIAAKLGWSIQRTHAHVLTGTAGTPFEKLILKP